MIGSVIDDFDKVIYRDWDSLLDTLNSRGEVSTNLSSPLGKLMALGYLESEIPFGEDEKNSKKSLYKISDPFMNFYFRFIVPNRSFIALGRLKPILNTFENDFAAYVSYYWEKLSREAVSGNEIDGITYGIALR